MAVDKCNQSDTEALILSAALEQFSRKGYAGATIRDISRRAGCNPVTIFRHFTDKETLFMRVVERYAELKFDSEALQARLRYTNLHADLTAIADCFFNVFFEHIHILRIFICEGAGNEWMSRYLWYLPAELRDFVTEYLETVYPREIPPRDGALLSELFLSYIARTCLRVNVHDGAHENSAAVARQARADMEQTVDFITALCRLHVEPIQA